jgi:hypothetical protein
MMLTNTWSNASPADKDTIAICASQIRALKKDIRERIDENMPIGAIKEWFTETVPDGFLHCNGQSVAVVSYYQLFLILGYRFGGSGANFNVPDCRGLFVRCFPNGKTGVDLDADAAVSCTADITGTGTTVESITGLAGVPRIGALVTGSGILTDTYIASITTFDADGIPTEFELTQAATTGAGITLTIDNDIIGSIQYDENKTHSHGGTKKGGELGTSYNLQGLQDVTGSSGGNESRPKSTGIMFIIRSDTI